MLNKFMVLILALFLVSCQASDSLPPPAKSMERVGPAIPPLGCLKLRERTGDPHAC